MKDKVERFAAPKGFWVRTALVYDGNLAPSVEADGYFAAPGPLRFIAAPANAWRQEGGDVRQRGASLSLPRLAPFAHGRVEARQKMLLQHPFRREAAEVGDGGNREIWLG